MIKIENYEFMQVFKTLKAQFILDVVLCLLFERKIVFISDDVRNNAQVVEALTRLISPLTWTGTVISLLSSNMIDYLDAPFPFIACVTKQFWKQICNRNQNSGLSHWDRLEEDVVAFDLATQTIYNKMALPGEPQPYTE